MIRSRRVFPGALLGAMFALSCTYNAATGHRQFSLIGEQQEVAMGREYSKQVASEIGLYPDEELQAYISRVGHELASHSERPNLPWEFHVVDDPGVNAFALPGGYIFITRGILAAFNSEAEMASVLGHEIGHVTARHSVEQMSRAQLAQIGLGVAMIASEDVRQYAGLAQAGLGVLFLKFSRDDERQADHLGLRYLTRSNYEAEEMPKVFEMLRKQSELAGGNRLPEWQSTHPSPEHRTARLEREILNSGIDQTHAILRHEEYLHHIEGLIFGPNPREGYVAGRTFYHPDLAFRLEFPAQWKILNQKAMVVGVESNKDAAIILSLSKAAQPSEAAQEFFQQEGVRRLQSHGHGFYDFLVPAATDQAGNTSPAAQGSVVFIRHDGKVFQLMGYSTQDAYSRYSGTIRQSLRSFRTLRDPAHLRVQAKKIELVRIKKAQSLRSFDARYPSTIPLEDLALLNGVEVDQRMEAGRLIKRVTGKDLPAN